MGSPLFLWVITLLKSSKKARLKFVLLSILIVVLFVWVAFSSYRSFVNDDLPMLRKLAEIAEKEENREHRLRRLETKADTLLRYTAVADTLTVDGQVVTTVFGNGRHAPESGQIFPSAAKLVLAKTAFLTYGSKINATDTFNYLVVRECIGRGVTVRGSGGKGMLLYQDTLDQFSYDGRAFKSGSKGMFVYIRDSEGSVSIENSHLEYVHIENSSINNLTLKNIHVKKPLVVDLRNSGKPYHITLDSIDFDAAATIEFLTVDDRFGHYIFYDTDHKDSRISLTARRTDMHKVKLWYFDFKLLFTYALNLDEMKQSYRQLMEKYQVSGQQESYERVDRDYKEFMREQQLGYLVGGLVNELDKWWWDYGYNRQLVVQNSVLFFLLFVAINFFLYTQLLSDGYPIKKFKEIDDEQKRKYLDNPIKGQLMRIPYVALYTGYIFWGLKLEKDNINVKHLGMFSYVLIQYVTGVVCLAYIANLIVMR